MKTTNKLNLPQTFVNFYNNEEKEIVENRYSVTEILKPIQQIILYRNHYKEITVDVADTVPAIFGSAVHYILEKNAPVSENVFSEYKFEQEMFGKYTLVGICDLLDLENKEVIDYKTSSVSKVQKGDFRDYYLQDMMYAYMTYLKFDVKIKKLKNYILMKDWSKIKFAKVSGYPTNPIYIWEKEISDSDFDFTERWLKERFEQIENGIVKCSEEERWYTGTKFAVYKNVGDKRAALVADTEQEAHNYITNKCDGSGQIEVRKGENLKCLYYCDCKKFCKQYNEED